MNLNSTDQKIDALYELLYTDSDGGALNSRMRLSPDASVSTYFEPVRNPVLTRADMERISRDGVASEMDRLLSDFPAGKRQRAVELINEISSELALYNAPGDETPSELIYAMH